MSRNKHISKKTSCFSRKRSKNKVKPNEFEKTHFETELLRMLRQSKMSTCI